MSDNNELVKKKVRVEDVVDSIVEKAYQIIEWRMARATPGYGDRNLVPEGYDHFHQDALSEILDLVKPMLGKAQETRLINAKTSNEVMKLLARGKVSMSEARELLAVLSSKLKVEEEEMKLDLKKTIVKEGMR